MQKVYLSFVNVKMFAYHFKIISAKSRFAFFISNKANFTCTKNNNSTRLKNSCHSRRVVTRVKRVA